MKIIALALLTLFASGSAFAKVGCTENDPAAVRFALAYMSILEIGLDSEQASVDGRSSDELCAQLESWRMSPSSRDGYTDVVLKVGNMACSIPLLLAADGRVMSSEPMVCSAASAN